MFLNTLKSNQPLVIVLIILSGILLWFYSILAPIGIAIPSDSFNMPFYEVFAKNLAYNSFLSILISFLLVLVQFNKKHIVINYRTYLPAFFYILLASSFVQLQRLNPVIIGSIFIFAAINFIYSTYRTEYALSRLYLAGFFVSIASLFWGPFAVFILIIWISLVILRPFIGREWIVGALGFLTPYLFVFTYYFVFLEESQVNGLINNFTRGFLLIKDFFSLHFSYYIFYGFLLLTIALASYTIVNNFQKKKIKNRKFFEINWWLFLICVIMFGVFRNITYEIIYIISIPISFLLTDYFYTSRKSWYLNLVLFIMIGSIVYIQITAH